VENIPFVHERGLLTARRHVSLFDQHVRNGGVGMTTRGRYYFLRPLYSPCGHFLSSVGGPSFLSPSVESCLPFQFVHERGLLMARRNVSLFDEPVRTVALI